MAISRPSATSKVTTHRRHYGCPKKTGLAQSHLFTLYIRKAEHDPDRRTWQQPASKTKWVTAGKVCRACQQVWLDPTAFTYPEDEL